MMTNREIINEKLKNLYDDVKTCDINTNRELRELLYRFIDFNKELLNYIDKLEVKEKKYPYGCSNKVRACVKCGHRDNERHMYHCNDDVWLCEYCMSNL